MDPASNCAAFEMVLPDYLDHALAPDAAGAAAAHVAACDACRELVRDLQAIRTQAAALPTLQPSRDLWSGVATRLGSRTAATDRERRATGADQVARQAALRRWFGPHYATRVAGLAAGLVVATAGLTYLVTRAVLTTRPTPPVIAAGRPTTNPPGNPSIPKPSTAATTQPPLVTTSGGSGQFVARTSEYLYDAQIASLHKIVEQRRGRLDPKTIVVIERSLRVIDTAIAQSKAALAKDPANGFLAGQLDRDLNTKLELLRTVALLPSRT